VHHAAVDSLSLSLSLSLALTVSAAEAQDSAVDTGGSIDAATPPPPAATPPAPTFPTPPYTLLAPADAPALLGSCGETWSEASGELEAIDALVMSETLLLSGESEGGPIRSRCVATLGDFTLPARHPANRAGEIPKTIALDLFTDVQLTARMIYWTWNDDGTVSWIGETVEQPRGTVVITVVDGWYSATVRKGKYSWTLKPDQACGGHWLGEYQDEWDGDDFVCGMDEEEEQASSLMSGTMASETMNELEPGFVDYGVRPDHPNQVLPTIDLLVVATPLARDELGIIGLNHGLIGYAHNRAHELDLSFLRTERQRTHRPRVVAVEVDVANNDFLQREGGHCHDDNRRAFQASADMTELRDEVGADLVALLSAAQPATPGCDLDGNGSTGLASNSYPQWEPGTDLGIFSMLVTVPTFDTWTFSHEAGHELGAGHANFRSTGGGVSAVHRYTDFTNTALHIGGQSHDYKMMVGAGDDPGCRLPVFPRNSPVTGFGWVPGSTGTGEDPCEYDDTLTEIYEPQYSLDTFGPDKYEVGPAWGETRLSGPENGVPIGRIDVDLPNPLDDYYRCQGDALFQLSGDDDPWSEPDTEWPTLDPNPCEMTADEDHSLAEAAAFYRPATTQPFEDHLLPEISLFPGSLGQIGGPEITLQFDMSTYAQELALPPGPTVCTDPTNQNCDFDINPYYLEIGTTFGADDLVSQWVTVESCNVAAGYCLVTPSTPIVTSGDDGPYATFDPSTVYFGRLWTQVNANNWGYAEFRLNTDLPNPAVSCNADSGEFAPPLGYEFACPTSANALLGYSLLVAADEQDGFPNRKTLQINLDPGSGVTQGGNAYIDHYRTTEPANPYDLVAFGELGDGTEFCCLYTFPDTEVVGVEVRGTAHADSIHLGAFTPLGFADPADPRYDQFGHVGALARGGADFIASGTTPDLRSYLHGGTFDDVLIVGSLSHGYVKGEGDDDWMAAWTEPRTSVHPTATLKMDGGGGTDTLIARSATSRRDHGHVQMFGGGGGNTLCTDSGAVKMVGSAAGHNFANTLYISSSYAPPFLTEYDIHPQTSAGTGSGGWGSVCGSWNHYDLHGAWAGLYCLYPADATPPAVPAGCEGWITP
jgi:hypothetical protein